MSTVHCGMARVFVVGDWTDVSACMQTWECCARQYKRKTQLRFVISLYHFIMSV